jgi:predicted metalloprotease
MERETRSGLCVMHAREGGRSIRGTTCGSSGGQLAMPGRLAVTLAAVLLLNQLAMVVPSVSAARVGVDGNSYESPNYGWTISWDDSWTVEDESVRGDYELLQLSDNLSVVFFEAYVGYDGDPEACVEDEENDLRSVDGFSNIELATDGNGDPITGVDSVGAYAVYIFDLELDDGTIASVVEYNDCRTLVEDEAVLEISLLTIKEAYNDAVPRMQDLLKALAMPGEEPIETEQDRAPRPGDDGTEIDYQELVPEITEDITDFWTDAFEDHDFFYVPPIYVVVLDEAEVPCGGGTVADPGSGSFYCPLNQTIYFDIVQLEAISEATDVNPGHAIYYVLAHEAGHDIQMQMGITLTNTLTVETELEADCMAGAYLATVVEAGDLDEDDFFTLLNVAFYIGDPEGTKATDEGAHGLGSQRITMVLRGYYNGVDACGTFEDRLPSPR